MIFGECLDHVICQLEDRMTDTSSCVKWGYIAGRTLWLFRCLVVILPTGYQILQIQVHTSSYLFGLNKTVTTDWVEICWECQPTASVGNVSQLHYQPIALASAQGFLSWGTCVSQRDPWCHICNLLLYSKVWNIVKHKKHCEKWWNPETTGMIVFFVVYSISQ